VYTLLANEAWELSFGATLGVGRNSVVAWRSGFDDLLLSYLSKALVLVASGHS